MNRFFFFFFIHSFDVSTKQISIQLLFICIFMFSTQMVDSFVLYSPCIERERERLNLISRIFPPCDIFFYCVVLIPQMLLKWLNELNSKYGQRQQTTENKLTRTRTHTHRNTWKKKKKQTNCGQNEETQSNKLKFIIFKEKRRERKSL